MSYASFLAQQAKQVFSFVQVSRKFLGDGWVYDGLSAWSIPWTKGVPVGVRVSLQSGANSFDLDENEFYLSEDRLYVESVNFNDGYYAYVEYLELYATEEIAFYFDPTDDGSPMVKWNQGLLATPVVKRSVADNYAGFSPSEISPVVIAHNGEDLWESLYADSFLNCKIDVWTCVGPIRSENTKKIFSGNILNVTFDDLKISFDLVENTDMVTGAYQGRYFSTQDWPAVDPAYAGAPIPLAFGTPRWIRAVNIDYIKEGAATTNNRLWGLYEAQGLISGNMNFTLGTVTSLGGGVYNCVAAEDSVRALNTGDWIQRPSDDVWGSVQVMSPTNFYLTTTPISSWTPASGNIMYRPAVQEVFAQIPSKQGVVLNWQAWQSFGSVLSEDLGDLAICKLTSTFEANSTLELAIATIQPDDFELWVRVAGSNHNVLLDGQYLNPYGGAHEVTALLWYLRYIIGIREDQINKQSFIDAVAVRTPFVPEFGGNSPYFLHPLWASDFEDHKTVIARLLQQIGAVSYFDADGLFTIKCRSVLGDAIHTLEDSDLLEAPKFEIRQDDIRGFALDANAPMVGCTVEVLKTKPATTSITVRTVDGVIGPDLTNAYALARGIPRFEAVQLYDVGKDAQSGGNYFYRMGLKRMADYYANRRLVVSIRTSGEVLDAEPGDVIALHREYIPGFPYVKGTKRTRKFFVLESTRSGGFLDLVMEDQFAIEQLGSF